MDIHWQDLHHTALSAAQVYELLKLRNAVFIVEQRCAYQDIDGQDLAGDNRHLLGMRDGVLLAYARILAPVEGGSVVKIGRVIVSDAARGLKLGNTLMQEAVRCCETHWPAHPIFLSAQAHLEAFYGQFGFVSVSDIYPEDDIPHIDMARKA